MRLALAAAVLAAGAFSAPGAAASDVRVVASIKPVHSLVSAVMEGVGEPYLIVQGAGSPHTFSIRPSDAAVLQDADVIFLIGEAMETSIASAVEALSGQARVVELSETPDLIRRPFREGGAFEDHDHDHGHDADEHDSFDMHLWLDPHNGAAMVRAIAGALSQADPAQADAYAANAGALLGRLDALTAQIAADLAPVRDKPFIVFHDAYQYFEDRFGLTAAGSGIVSAERSPGMRRMRDLRETVREHGVTCVFAEPRSEERLVNVIVEDTPARVGIVDPLGTTLDSGAELYLALLRNMSEAFRNCLAPEEPDGSG